MVMFILYYLYSNIILPKTRTLTNSGKCCMPGKSRLTSYLLKKSARTNTMRGVTTTRNLILRKHGQKFRHRNLATLWSEYSKTDSNQINMDLFVAQPPINHSLTLKPLDYKDNGSHTTVINLLSKDF